MPSEPNTVAESAMTTEGESSRSPTGGGKWRDDSPPQKTEPKVTTSDSSDPASKVALAAPTSATWRLTQWLRIPRVLRRRLSPWLSSVCVHAVALILLGLWVTRHELPIVGSNFNVTAVEQPGFGADDLQIDTGLGDPMATADDGKSFFPSASSSVDDVPAGPIDLEVGPPADAISSTTTFSPQALSIDSLLPGSQQSTNWGAIISKGGGLNGRSPVARGKLAGSGGGSRFSEEAVERGLKWILSHQREDGSWRFHFDGLPCNNTCRNPGTEATSTGSTALALLPFYGAGYTHHEGPYQEQVSKGLYYLCNRMLVTPQGGDLQEGTMYAQGLATIVLCEAYGMSKDEKLRPYAEQALKFVLYAQDQRGGGWRYTPGMPGDTTMTGWQLMALKSGLMAGLEVPSSRFFLTGKFLDGVQSERGAAYGYRTTVKRPSTSAVGLLCRMYLGWGRTHPAVREGVQFFDRLGPSPTDMYMNYYATQLMFHHSGAPWDRWNKKMRDYLIKTQSKEGHESGSWQFEDQHGNAGGRLYNTAISILILEVYYRYLPLHSARAVDEGF